MEIRAMPLELTEEPQARTIEGYAAVFDEETILFISEYSGYTYKEVIARGAFDNTDFTNCVLNYNHGGMMMARTQSGTLRLTTDSRGLKVEADMANTSNGNDVYELIKRGDLSKMSFAFTVAKESETVDRENKIYTRRIEQVDSVYDVSIVDNPAYEGTEVVSRNHKTDDWAHEKEQRKRLLLKLRTM